MKLFGSLTRLVSIVFRKSGFDVTVEPVSASANTVYQLPAAGGGTKAIVTADATQTLTNKTIDADQNTISNIENADIKASAGIVESKLSLDYSTSSLNTAVTNAQDDIDDLVALSGVAANAVDLGTFSGTIIPDASTVKGAIQSLETYVDALPDPFFYAGTYNASTNSPALANTDTGKNGYVYYVTTAGSQDFGAGSISFAIGDKVANNGTSWDKWDMTDAVTSVNGQNGVVSLDSDDIAEGSTNLYFSDERAQDAVGTILTDSSSIDFTYNDGTPSITAAVLPGGVDHDALLNFVANEHVDHSSVSINTAADSGLSGGGNITASRSLVIDPNNAQSVSAAAGDLILIADASDSNALKKVTAQSIADLAAGSAAQSFTWVDGSATKACSHSFSTRAVLVEVYDENFETVMVDIVDRNTTSQVTLTRSEATVGGDWTVVIRN